MPRCSSRSWLLAFPCYFADENGESWRTPWQRRTTHASIRFPFPSAGSTVKCGHGTFPLPQLCVCLSQPLSALQDLTWEDTHMPSNCLPDGAAFSPAPHVLISCICGSFALSFHCRSSSHYPSMHSFPFTSMYPSIHESIQLKQLSKPLSAPAASLSSGADSHWAMLSSVMTVSSGVWRNSLHKDFFFAHNLLYKQALGLDEPNVLSAWNVWGFLCGREGSLKGSGLLCLDGVIKQMGFGCAGTLVYLALRDMFL